MLAYLDIYLPDSKNPGLF